jgi:hypothetical protein
VNALRRIHAALVPGGLVVDTQPVSPHPAVESPTERLGTLDMSEWLETIEAVDELTARTIDEGLYSVETEQSFIVVDTFDTGAELVDKVPQWRGTRMSDDLRRRAVAAEPPLSVHQEIRLRLLRALDAG